MLSSQPWRVGPEPWGQGSLHLGREQEDPERASEREAGFHVQAVEPKASLRLLRGPRQGGGSPGGSSRRHRPRRS